MDNLWRDAYSVGVKSMDLQHQKLLSYVAELSAVVRDKKMDCLHDILYKLTDYAVTHFQAEESLLAHHGYDAESHGKRHAEYSAYMAEANFNAIIGKLDLHGLTEFLQKWWVDHILEEDMAYKEFLNLKGVY